MIINRIWSMPNSETFRIQPINHLIRKYLNEHPGKWIDPFVRNSVFKGRCCKTNDLNPDVEADYNEDAWVFLNRFNTESIDGCLFDPPYSLRQRKECYDGIGITLTQVDSRDADFSLCKIILNDIIKPGGIVICCGWSSRGVGSVGMNNNFEIIEILLVPHGGAHNDTIVTVERKLATSERLL